MEAVSFVSGKVGVRRGRAVSPTHQAFTRDQMTQHLNDYHEIVRSRFQETAPRETTDNTVKHCNGGVGSMVANHCDGGESSVVVTTLVVTVDCQNG